MISAALLDTDTLSHLMRQDRSATAHALAYLTRLGDKQPEAFQQHIEPANRKLGHTIDFSATDQGGT